MSGGIGLREFQDLFKNTSASFNQILETMPRKNDTNRDRTLTQFEQRHMRNKLELSQNTGSPCPGRNILGKRRYFSGIVV